MESTPTHRTTSLDKTMKVTLHLRQGETTMCRWQEAYMSHLTTMMTATSERGIKVCGERRQWSEGGKGKGRGREREGERERERGRERNTTTTIHQCASAPCLAGGLAYSLKGNEITSWK